MSMWYLTRHILRSPSRKPWKRLYFVVETKSNLFQEGLRGKESAKMDCGAAHFKALGVGESPARYIKATCEEDVRSYVGDTNL